MSVYFESGYAIGGSDEPLTHARIAHANNWLSGSVSPPFTEDADRPASAADSTLTYEKYYIASSVNQPYTYSASGTADYFLIAAHNLNDYGGDISLRVNSSSQFTITIPSDGINEPIFCIFSPRSGSEFELYFTGFFGAEVGVIKFGQALQMPRPMFGGIRPPRFTQEPVLRQNISETGEFLGRSVHRRFSEDAFTWQNIDADWFYNNWYDLQTAVEDEPLAVAWRPLTYGDVSFGQVLQTPIPQTQGTRNLMSVTLEMRGYGHV